jgi:hypothetical protein
MSDKIGIINEIGDIGIGFDLLNEQDQKTYNDAVNQEKDKTENGK